MTMKGIVHTVSSKKQLLPEIVRIGDRNDNLYSDIVTTNPSNIKMRKPFDAIVEGLVLKNGAESRTWLELFFCTIKHMLDELPHALQLITRLIPARE